MLSLDQLSLFQVSSYLRHTILPRAFRWTGDLNDLAMRLHASGKLAEAAEVQRIAQHIRELTTAYNDIAWRLAEKQEDTE